MNDAKLTNTEQQGCGDMMGDGLARHGMDGDSYGNEHGDGGVDAAGDAMEWAELGDLLLGRGLVCSGSWSWSCVFVKMRPQITEAVTIF